MVNELDIIKVINKNIINDLHFLLNMTILSFCLVLCMHSVNIMVAFQIKVSVIYISLPNVNIYSLCLSCNFNFYAYISLEHHATSKYYSIQ